MSLASHPLPAPPLPHVSIGGQTTCMPPPPPALAFDSVATQAACKEMSGCNGTMLMGVPAKLRSLLLEEVIRLLMI